MKSEWKQKFSKGKIPTQEMCEKLCSLVGIPSLYEHIKQQVISTEEFYAIVNKEKRKKSKERALIMRKLNRM